ncbi:MAG: putative metal-binding motif-containing protein [Myxococcales bacterium]|nr:putative metal-binding motif-containing protein [Myxococcales bacterium]
MRTLWGVGLCIAAGCAGTVPGAPATVVDADGDGFASDVDCDDSDPGIRGPSIWSRDDDGDGAGAANSAVSGCQPGPGWVSYAELDDCDDTDPAVGVPQVYYADLDGDGFSGSEVATLSCVPLDGFTTAADDCDDEVATTFPGAPELCDGVDNDCAFGIDQGEACGAWISLGFDVRDVDLDRVNERLLAVLDEASGSSATLVSVVDGSTTEISLLTPMDFVSVAPDGGSAIVANAADGQVVWIDLDALEAYPASQFSEISRIEDVHAIGGQQAVVLDQRGILVVDAVEGTVVQQGFPQHVGSFVTDPTGSILYGLGTGLHRFEVDDSGIHWVSNYGIGLVQDVWMSNGGGHLYDSDGRALSVNADPKLDMTYLTTLPRPNMAAVISGIVGSEEHDRVFTLGGSGLHAFGFDWTAPLGEVLFPEQTPSGKGRVIPRQVFVADAAERLVVLGTAGDDTLLWSRDLSSVP